MLPVRLSQRTLCGHPGRSSNSARRGMDQRLTGDQPSIPIGFSPLTTVVRHHAVSFHTEVPAGKPHHSAQLPLPWK